MEDYNFALVAFYTEHLDEDAFLKLSDVIYEVGCNDATISHYGHILVIDFNREAESYEEAINSAAKSLNQISGLIVQDVCCKV